LELATDHKLKSISFPSISTGIYGYPVAEAAKVALDAVIAFLRDEPNSLEKVYFVLYDSKTYKAYSAKLAEVAG
jgi:O-acetyl-ADP-ribose deacetylase (regulator of RNase III)